MAQSLDADTGAAAAGSGGDPVVAAQGLTGVARPTPGATGLVMWGAQAAESRVLYEGIELPALYHQGGFRATTGAALVGRVEVVPAAFSAAHGRSVGGLVRLDARAIPLQESGLVLDVNTLDVGLAAHGSWQDVAMAAAARVSDLHVTYGRFAPAATTALYPVPRYADAQAEVSRVLANGGKLRLLGLWSHDEVTKTFGASLPGVGPRQEHVVAWWWRAGLVYGERRSDDGFSSLIYLGREQSSDERRFSTTPTVRDQQALSLGAHLRYRADLTPSLQATVGLDLLVQRSRYRQTGSITVPAREGDLGTFAQPPGDDVNADRWSVRGGDVAAYALASWRRGGWNVSPGARLEAFPVEGDRATPPAGNTPQIGYARLWWTFDPRVALTFRARPGLVLRGAGGLYHQAADPGDRSPVFGAPTLPPASAVHVVLGGWCELAGQTGLDVDAFFRSLDHLPRRSTLPAPLLGEVLVAGGAGRAFGVSATLRRELALGLRGWATYTLSRSERTSPSGGRRLFDGDQTHVLTVVAARSWGAWSLSTRGRYATGSPRTPVIGGFFDARDQRTEPLFGPQNGMRLPAFWAVDARVDRRFIGAGWRLTLSLDVENLTGHRNAEEIVYTQDFSASGYLTGPPLLVLFGVRLEV